MRDVTVSIPAPIRGLGLSMPAGVSEALDASTRAITALESAHASSLTGLGAMLVRTESVASSKIEHISAGIDDYARAMHGSRANSSAVAMVGAGRAIEGLLEAVVRRGAVLLEDVLHAHRLLMADDRSEAAHSGRLRVVQNWIGGSDWSPREALFVPPPPDLVPSMMDDLVDFIRREDMPSLLQATIAHAQFETIHPFTDGNGRIGRALIQAVLRSRGATKTVVLPIASGVVARRDAYFQALDHFCDGDAEPVVTLVAEAALDASEESARTAERLRDLPEQWRSRLGRTRRGSAPDRLIAELVSRPVVSTADVEAILSSGSSVAHAAVDRLVDVGILRPLTDRRRNQVWAAGEVLDELSDLDRRIQDRRRR